MGNRVIEDDEIGGKSTRRNSSRRSSKVAEGRIPTPKATEVARTEEKLKQFVPTESQKQMINKIRGNTITFVQAVAGVGKTAATLWYFCQEYLKDPSLKIVVIRTPVEIGNDKIGFLPDSLESKLSVHFASTQRILEDFLGKGKVAADMGKRIEFVAPNYMLGATLDNCLVLADECQQLSIPVLKLLLERIGKNCKFVVAGSNGQLYGNNGHDRNALLDAMQRFFIQRGNSFEPKYDGFAYHTFTIDDVQRSEIVKSVIRAYEGV